MHNVQNDTDWRREYITKMCRYYRNILMQYVTHDMLKIKSFHTEEMISVIASPSLTPIN